MVLGYRLQEAHGQQHHVGIAEPEVDQHDHHAGHEWIGVPVGADAEQRLEQHVDLAEILVEQALEDQDRDEGRHRVGQDQHQAVERLAAQMRPLQDHRQQHAQREGERHRERREHQRPDEDRQHRRADALGREDALEIGPADIYAPAWRYFLAGVVDVKAGRLVGLEHFAVGDRDEAAVGFEAPGGRHRGEGAQARLLQRHAVGQRHRYQCERVAQRHHVAHRHRFGRTVDGIGRHCHRRAVERHGIGEEAALAFGQEDAIGGAVARQRERPLGSLVHGARLHDDALRALEGQKVQ